MQFEIISNRTDLAALNEEWSRLVIASPMQSLDWLTTWWDCYADSSCALFIVTAREAGKLIGIAPWYSQLKGNRRVLRWLGDGHVCSDHASLLSTPADYLPFARALAGWLLDDRDGRWHELRLEAINSDDVACRQFTQRLVEAGSPHLQLQEPGSCYIDLPSSFEEYLMSVSKNHRKRCRRWEKAFFQSGRAELHVATAPQDCLALWQSLIQLHNDRRASLGQQGAFEDSQFETFHQQVLPRLASAEHAQLRLLEIDGQTVAAEYVLQQGTTWFAYQSGMSQAGEELSAGSLSILALVKDAIAAGCTRLDLLRGDEPYKFSWGAVHRPAATTIIRRDTSAARLLTLTDTAWIAAKRLRRSLISQASSS